MKKAALTTMLLVSACSSGHYSDAAAFKSDVESWGIVGLPVDAAVSKLSMRKFICKAQSCARDIEGFPCAQRLKIELSLNAQRRVESFGVGTINGKLPEVCL